MRSASTSELVVIALGSNLGPRQYLLRRAVHELAAFVRVVRQSSVHATAPVDAPKGSPDFLNMVVAGTTRLDAMELLSELHGIEARLGRVRGVRNAPRPIDLDLILYGAHLMRNGQIVVPHPRYREREFVLAPLRELRLPWRDPATGIALHSL
jgi:2-amino-4-hydroxy-6-hydroxymethyldihydropteridine diphosphokinase